MKKKKLKLKKKVKVFLVLIVVVLLCIIIGVKLYKNYKYKQTYEYKLSLVNYTQKEIKLLKDNLSNDELDLLLEQDKDEDLLDLLDNEFYIKDNLDRYKEYQKKNYTDVKTTIKMVNINRDYDFYEKTFETNVNDNYEMLVNKYYLLTEKYEPDDLVKIDSKYAWGDTKYIRQAAYDAFTEMWKAAKEEGYYLMINSAYRTFEEQEEVYKEYEDAYDKNYADSIAARPGASEHQTGLALDIFEKDNSKSKTFKDTEVYEWLKSNCYKYGFILRYPEGLEDITGYDFESWHYRFVGKEIANEIFKLNISYDEYYANYKD